MTIQLIEELSERERQVAARVARGKSNWVIAHELGLTEAQVKNSLREIYEKLDLASQSQPIARERRQRVRSDLADWWWSKQEGG